MSISGSENRRRFHAVTVRMDADEKQRVAMTAQRRGLSTSAYMRDTALQLALPNVRRGVSADGQHIALILASLARLMDQLKMHDHEAKIVGFPAIVDEIMAAREHCFKALGRHP